MNIRTPHHTQAARILKQFMKEQGIALKHTQALEAVARLHGYQSYQAMQADARFAEPLALKPMSSDEYELGKGQGSAWIGVDNISVYVRRNDEGVSVDLFAKSDEMADSLAGTSLCFHEASEVLADAEDDESAPAFTPVLVDWSVVADLEDLSHLRFNDGARREIVYAAPAGELAGLERGVVGDRLRMAFCYSIADAFGQVGEVTLGALEGAVEVSPGVLRLSDGRHLELLVETGEGFERFSPALNRTFKAID